MDKKSKTIVAALFCVPLALTIAVQPSIAQTNALMAKKAAKAQYMADKAKNNIFHAPRDIQDVVWMPMYDRHDMIHKVSLGYTKLPRSRSASEFADIESFAKKFVGVQYTPGGKSPSTGFDCSGFVLYVYRNCGSRMQLAGSVEQYNYCRIIPDGYEKPGDLVFFKGTGIDPDAVASHVGIYLGDRKMIHAGNTGIAIVDLDNEYWPQHFLCFGRPIVW